MRSDLGWRIVGVGMTVSGLVDHDLSASPWCIQNGMTNHLNPERVFHHKKVGWLTSVGLKVPNNLSWWTWNCGDTMAGFMFRNSQGDGYSMPIKWAKVKVDLGSCFQLWDTASGLSQFWRSNTGIQMNDSLGFLVQQEIKWISPKVSSHCRCPAGY